jgi:hypothetical protein
MMSQEYIMASRTYTGSVVLSHQNAPKSPGFMPMMELIQGGGWLVSGNHMSLQTYCPVNWFGVF